MLIFSSTGTFQRTFRLPFPSTSIAVNRKRDIFVTPDTARPTELVYVFSDTGKFLRRFGERLIKSTGNLARNINIAVAAFDANDNLFVAFRSWPLIRKYSPDGQLISSFIPPIITHSISINGRGTGYLLLNAHSIVILGPSGKVPRQFHFRAPRDRENVFIRLVASPGAKTQTYFLDTESGEIYTSSKL